MKYVGIKQVLKAAKTEKLLKVYIGKDVEKNIVEELIKICNEKHIEIIYVETMKELGKLAGIEVRASVAAE